MPSVDVAQFDYTCLFLCMARENCLKCLSFESMPTSSCCPGGLERVKNMTRYYILIKLDRHAEYQPITDVRSIRDRRCDVQAQFQITGSNLDVQVSGASKETLD